MPLSPLQPHPQAENVLPDASVSPSLKRKRTQSALCRTPSADMLPPPEPRPATNEVEALGVTARKFGIVVASSTSISDEDIFGSRAVINQQARGEEPDDVPPIAFLREQSRSLSPAPSARNMSPLASVDTLVPPAPRISVVSFSFTSAPLHATTADNAPQPPTSSSTDAARRSQLPTGFTFYTAPAPSEPTAAVARTRAETAASASEPAPRYRYTYDSLMRRPAAPSAGGHYRNAFYEPGDRGELEAACETAEAPVGGLGGPPVLGLAGVAAMLERLRGQTMGRDVLTPAQPDSVQPRPNTAPTAEYLSLLEETFGPGNMLRGGGAKPVGLSRQRKPGAAPRATGAGRSGSSSSGAPDEMDVDMEASGADADTQGGFRAPRWIAEIEVLLKGKRQLVREDLKSLADTMREITNMDAAEGRALGDDASRLRKSIWQLAQFENIPYRDEHKLRRRARKLLKHWPA
ncbi:hypothetical protein B0H17DRAFT_438523 [Mycena rosella]|uniref:Uncharacterized protein n=1 Tax=Mycena rosella TaxID=1033263 RepID=A0AAD7CDE0_MYCRO|nr:hypothetical protein B0H17DRAFT_438523 [Mycena rosella]